MEDNYISVTVGKGDLTLTATDVRLFQLVLINNIMRHPILKSSLIYFIYESVSIGGFFSYTCK